MNECLLTIDFEDFKHDLKRYLGSEDTSGSPEGLIKSIEAVNKILLRTNSSKFATYFVTGQVAKDYPDIVRSLAKSGNEIACHSNYHDMIYNMSRNEFCNSLDSAITHLKNAAGQDICGFRAPNFSINENCKWAYEEIASRFLYDSSSLLDKKLTNPIQNLLLKGNHLLSLPIYNPVLFLNKRVRVIGGTFLKILPLSFILSYMKEASDNGYLPIIYIHPYELLTDKEFWVNYNQMNNTKISKKIYWRIRQNQWLSFGNKLFIKKLEKILNVYNHSGTVLNYLKDHSYL